MTATAIEEIDGQWFVCVDSTYIDSASLRFANRGNGNELVGPDGVYGPFATEGEASAWLADYEKE